jgi:anthranilate phosphoribosyltransferase
VSGTGAPDAVAPTAPWNEILTRLTRREDLPRDAATVAMRDIMTGRAGPSRIAALLMGLRAKGETADEVAAAAEAMRDEAVAWPVRGAYVDIVGTGGDGSGTVNISTLAAVIIATSGIPVVKHGNRAATSASGAADVLEALGLPLDAPVEVVAQVATEEGLGFAFAPVFHPAMRFAAPVRRELGVPTVFNILGPLTNPARPITGLIGCADARLAPIMAEVFDDRGERMLVVRGEDGWDEITPQAPTRWWYATGRGVEEGVLEPGMVGLDGISGADLAGGSAQHNAEVMRAALGLPRREPTMELHADPAAVAAVAVANAAGALAAAQLAGLTAASEDLATPDSLDEAIALHLPRAAQSVASGNAGAVLTRWIERMSEVNG